MMNRQLKIGTLIGGMMLVLIVARTSSAASFTIDNALSSVTITAQVEVGGNLMPLGPQGGDPASLTTALEGTIQGTASPTLISLVAGASVIDAMLNPNAEFLPAEGGAVLADEIPVGSPDGIFTPGEDNIGAELNLGILGSAYGALRDLVLTAEGSGDPSVAGSATGIGFNITNGYFSFDAGPVGAGEEDQSNTGDPATFNLGGDLGYSLVGLTETVTIPIDVSMNDGAVLFSGRIVAARTIPEPVSLLLLGSGIALMLGIRRR
jgi:hypothetical protein